MNLRESQVGPYQSRWSQACSLFMSSCGGNWARFGRVDRLGQEDGLRAVFLLDLNPQLLPTRRPIGQPSRGVSARSCRLPHTHYPNAYLRDQSRRTAPAAARRTACLRRLPFRIPRHPPRPKPGQPLMHRDNIPGGALSHLYAIYRAPQTGKNVPPSVCRNGGGRRVAAASSAWA